MKKLFLLLAIIIVGISLTGCTQQTKTTEQGLTKSELFEKKQECAKYKNKIESEIQKEAKDCLDIGSICYSSLSEIFYSQTENTCIALVRKERKRDDERLYFYSIIDILSTDTTDYPRPDKDSMNSYITRLKELKGE